MTPTAILLEISAVCRLVTLNILLTVVGRCSGSFFYVNLKQSSWSIITDGRLFSVQNTRFHILLPLRYCLQPDCYPISPIYMFTRKDIPKHRHIID
ncbi:hypothetical protein BDQ17DRAFT_1365042 [Cyathus striatus]|nr:hypothetical protein BDQ17DRAFT_1365042 [Cyathus striatus]